MAIHAKPGARHNLSSLDENAEKRINELYQDIEYLGSRLKCAGPKAKRGYQFLIDILLEAFDKIYEQNYKR